MNFCLESSSALADAKRYVSRDKSLYCFVLTTGIDGTDYGSLEHFARIFFELHHSTVSRMYVFAPRIYFEGTTCAEDVASVLYSGVCLNFEEEVDISAQVSDFIRDQIATSVEIARSFGVLDKIPCILFSRDLEPNGEFTTWGIAGYKSHDVTRVFRVISQEIEAGYKDIYTLLRKHRNELNKIDRRMQDLDREIVSYEELVQSLDNYINKTKESLSTSRKNVVILKEKAEAILSKNDENYTKKHNKVFEGQHNLRSHIQTLEKELLRLEAQRRRLSLEDIEDKNYQITKRVNQLRRKKRDLENNQAKEMNKAEARLPNPIDLVKGLRRKEALIRLGKGAAKEAKNYIPFKDILKGGFDG